MGYTETFKREMVKRLTVPGAPSAITLSKEVGVSNASLSKWVRDYGRSESGPRPGKTPKSWSAEEKLEAISETRGLTDEQVGEYLRRKGLHSFHLGQWKKEIMGGLEEATRPKRKNTEYSLLKKRNKELERELRRKDRALAETTALLVLQKKAQLIWGVKEVDESY
jgi:transposase-like protein